VHGARHGGGEEASDGSRRPRPDGEKARQWRRLIQEAANSGLSIREFCRRQGTKDSRFYLLQRRLKSQLGATKAKAAGAAGWKASFALVREEPGELQTMGIELVLADGRRLRIGRGLDEPTLRTVLAVLEPGRC